MRFDPKVLAEIFPRTSSLLPLPLYPVAFAFVPLESWSRTKIKRPSFSQILRRSSLEIGCTDTGSRSKDRSLWKTLIIARDKNLEISASHGAQWTTERSAGRPSSQAGFSERLNQSRFLSLPLALLLSLSLSILSRYDASQPPAQVQPL